MNDAFSSILESVSPESQELAIKARFLIYSVYPQAVEIPWIKQKVIGYGVGPKKMSEHFVYLSVSKNHINIGFYYGAELLDSAHLLQGEGKLLKHIRIENLAQLDDLNLKELIRQAAGYLPKLAEDDPRPLKSSK